MLAMFYGIDVLFKIFQGNFIDRTEKISNVLCRVTTAETLGDQDAILRDDDFPEYHKYFVKNGERGFSKWKIAFQLHTIWLYVLTIALAIVGFLAGTCLGFFPDVLPADDTACQLCSSADTAASARL